MPNYTALAATAKRLIEAAGRPVTAIARPQTAADPAKPWRGPGEAPPAFSEEVVGVILDNKATAATSDLTRRGDKRALVAATSTDKDLTLATQLDDGTVIWEIVSCELLNPGDTALLYTMELKR